MPVIRMRRPGTSPLGRAAGPRAGRALPPRASRRGQALLDRIQPAPDRPQLLAQLAEVVRGRRPALLDRLLDALPNGAGAGLGAADQLVDRVLGARPRRLGALARRLEGAVDGLT